ncbi:MAG: NAD-dependent epimerase/dehydratase family protein, partial [Acidobacteriia bacterium]|nr:NAD-dependent epimerase/dehydratase family protein [Terriglobia bacterium]
MTDGARDGRERPVVLITGASGYIGGRLLAKLEQAGYRIRCLSRHPEYLQSRLGPTAVALRGDVLDAESLRPA